MYGNKFFFFSVLVLIYFNNNCYGQIRPTRQLTKPYLPEDAKLNFTEFAKKYGTHVEDFDVTTEDGYILNLFHIVANRKANSPPVFLQHGVADSADSFIVRGRSSLAMTLAEAGYNVWVGNTRGNKYGRRHLTLDPDRDKAFWDFSLQENGYYDVPANLDFIIKKTGSQKVTVIAHSQGTTDSFVLGSTRPEYNEKINLLIAMAPVAFLHHVKTPLDNLVHSAPIVNFLLNSTGQEELLADHSLNKVLLEFICAHEMLSYQICVDGLFFALGGSDPSQFEKEFLPVFIGHYPQATSRKSLLHLAQIAKSKSFAHFDYGVDGNLERYKTKIPPPYNLGDVTIKTALFVGRNDPISTFRDVKLLKKRLPHVVDYVIMDPPKWNHLDFTSGRQMDKYLYPHIFRLLDIYK